MRNVGKRMRFEPVAENKVAAHPQSAITTSSSQPIYIKNARFQKVYPYAINNNNYEFKRKYLPGFRHDKRNSYCTPWHAVWAIITLRIKYCVPLDWRTPYYYSLLSTPSIPIPCRTRDPVRWIIFCALCCCAVFAKSVYTHTHTYIVMNYHNVVILSVRESQKRHARITTLARRSHR